MIVYRRAAQFQASHPSWREGKRRAVQWALFHLPPYWKSTQKVAPISSVNRTGSQVYSWIKVKSGKWEPGFSVSVVESDKKGGLGMSFMIPINNVSYTPQLSFDSFLVKGITNLIMRTQSSLCLKYLFCSCLFLPKSCNSSTPF